MNLFENVEARKMFYNISETLKGEKKRLFSEAVRELYFKKSTGESEYPVYQVTKDEVASLAKVYA